MILFAGRNTFTRSSFRRYTCAALLDPSLHLLQRLQLAIDRQCLKLTEQSHARVLSHGFDQNVFIATKLISAYATCNDTGDARLVFCSIRQKNVYLWNSLISGYAKNRGYAEAFNLFNQMCWGQELPDDFTLATMTKISGELVDVVAGKSIHGRSIRIGFVSDAVVSNSIMSMYYKCGEFSELRKLFDEMPQRNSGSWNAIIAGCAMSEECIDDGYVWKLVKDMQIEGMKPDSYTVSSLLPLCDGDTGKWDYGRELHCCILKNELDLDSVSNVHLGCCLIDMYSRNNKVIMGRRVFDRMKFRNIFAWTAMINGYVQCGASDEALILFQEMQKTDGIEPNRVSVLSMLPACSAFGGLMGGRQIHGFAIRKEFNHEVSLCNALIDMYSKCGRLDCARRVFEDGSLCKDVISWSSMITGYGLHGSGHEAICLYEKMLRHGIGPDKITIVGVLSACGRSGMVNEGLNIYCSAINDYGIEPTLEICACVVDMLGRSGQLERALDFIKTMPVEPGPTAWGALVSASLIHGNFKMQDLAYRFLVQLEPDNPSNYVSLSNVYASSKRWDVVAEVRGQMKKRRLRKLPGCSWVSINSTTHCFYVADDAHPCYSSIYDMLRNLIMTMKGAGYSPDFENLT